MVAIGMLAVVERKADTPLLKIVKGQLMVRSLKQAWIIQAREQVDSQ